MSAKQSKIIMLHSRKLTMSIGPTITLYLLFSLISKPAVRVSVSLSISRVAEPPLKKVAHSFIVITSEFNVIRLLLSFFPI
uniref:Uncharacterized protein n=1 Tax=Setaria italica TaxID=4555 RepID=K4AHF8_SETIT